MTTNATVAVACGILLILPPDSNARWSEVGEFCDVRVSYPGGKLLFCPLNDRLS